MKVEHPVGINKIQVIEEARNDFFGLAAGRKVLPKADLIAHERFSTYAFGIDHLVFNGVWCHDAKPLSEVDVDRLMRYFEDKKLPFLWWEAPVAMNMKHDDAVLRSDLLKQKGMQQIDDLVGVYRTLDANDGVIQLPEGVHIEYVASKEALTMMSAMMVSEFGFSAEIKDHFEAVMRSITEAGDGVHFLAYKDKIPLAGITLSTGKHFAGIWNEPQHIPGYAPEGIGAALVQAAMNEAKKRGYREIMAILMSDDLINAWQPLGFEPVCRFRGFTPNLSP